jgi:hypothetical protein
MEFAAAWAVQAASIIFVVVSLYFGSAPIFSRPGSFLGYAYWVLGIVLILLYAVSFKVSVANRATPGILRPGT